MTDTASSDQSSAQKPGETQGSQRDSDSYEEPVFLHELSNSLTIVMGKLEVLLLREEQKGGSSTEPTESQDTRIIEGLQRMKEALRRAAELLQKRREVIEKQKTAAQNPF